ncbi:hypothetical protein [Pseudomonas baetica]|uniref:hypothetical protein n=1 Tax=Pseudomonas baetica TaxID=674054 RepID=UPI0024064865|nr:hypothetical protein [Pseudomonas baetica]MDF9778861.1 hypothetical protein [Pseudomonas baetica]
MSQNETDKGALDKVNAELHRIAAQRDLLLLALESLLEHEGTVDSTGIGDFPSEALGLARNQAIAAIAEVKASLSE